MDRGLLTTNKQETREKPKLTNPIGYEKYEVVNSSELRDFAAGFGLTCRAILYDHVGPRGSKLLSRCNKTSDAICCWRQPNEIEIVIGSTNGRAEFRAILRQNAYFEKYRNPSDPPKKLMLKRLTQILANLEWKWIRMVFEIWPRATPGALPDVFSVVGLPQ